MVRCSLMVLLGSVPFSARAQQPDSLPPVPNVPVAVSFFAPLLVPVKVMQDESVLRDFVVSPEFASYRRTRGDPAAVDLLFRHGLQLAWGNTGEALLICMLATFDHRTVGIRLPVVHVVLWIPLTGEFRDDFRMRVDSLPSVLYPDTPPEGDRDKLQHFFGSAFLTVLTGSTESADDVGEFVETGEEAFIVGGVNDVRDVRANQEGQRFAEALMADEEALPSNYLGR